MLLNAAEKSPSRPYNVVILSDHGQVRGTRYHELYGRSIDDAMQSLLPAGAPPVVSQDFGSGTHVYLNYSKSALDRSDAEAQYPGLVSKVVALPGVAFVVARDGAATCIEGKNGSVRVDGNQVTGTGQNPLLPFGNAAQTVWEIHDAAHRDHAGDLMLFGDQLGDRLVDFSESTLRGLHGGIGCDQDAPFMTATPGMHLNPGGTLQSGDLYRQLLPYKPKS